MKITYVALYFTKILMYAIIDIEVTPFNGWFPTPKNSDIVTMSLIVTDFNEMYQHYSLTVDTIQSVREQIETNIVISYCYSFESRFLKNHKINPTRYIDLNYLLEMGSLELTCKICKVPFHQNNICKTLYSLSKVNLFKINKLQANTSDNRAYKL